jgi:hypothetical protein
MRLHHTTPSRARVLRQPQASSSPQRSQCHRSRGTVIAITARPRLSGLLGCDVGSGLINAVTGEVGTGTKMSGYPTNQDLIKPECSNGPSDSE